PICLAAVGLYAEANIPVAPACGERVSNAKKTLPLLIPDQTAGAAPERTSGRSRLKTLGGVSFETRFDFYPNCLDRARRSVASALHRAAEATTEAAAEKAHARHEADADADARHAGGGVGGGRADQKRLEFHLHIRQGRQRSCGCGRRGGNA